MWTVQRARELLHEFREALRFEVAKFNEHRATKKIGIVTEVVTPLKPKDVQPDDDILNINIILATGISLRILLLLAFSLLVWSANCRRSILTFLARDAGSILFYLVFCRQGGAIILNTALIEHAALQTIVNLFATTRLSFCHYRLFNWLKRKEWKESKSNFSSIATVDSMADIRQLNYYIAKYTKYQAAQDAFSKDRFEQITKYWWILSIAIFPIVILYWMYVDATCHLMLAAVCPTIFAAAMEEFWLKRKYLR
uniref:Uncharacterized protein n=1 Tax=Caenorhabditis japonica TaxID=281687 RepID=A0A8R1HJY4_CAEJA